MNVQTQSEISTEGASKPIKKVRAIDMFCGAGGSSWGARVAGVEIVAGFDMWDLAQSVYCDNFPEAKFYGKKLEELDPNKISKELGEIDLIIASPECTNHSPAKGNGIRCEKSKETAFQVVRFARSFKPRWIIVENVVSMRKWSRYNEFIDNLHELGYQTREQALNSKDFGVPQSRRRLFIICDMEHSPPEIKPICRTLKPAFSIIDSNGRYKTSPLRKEKRAEATLDRADRAINALGEKSPFLVVYYSTDHAGGWQRLDVPLRTITTIDRFALVRPTQHGHEMRMLQPSELQKAMGMSIKFKFEHGTRRDKIKFIGNAVCPPVMQVIVAKLIAEVHY